VTEAKNQNLNIKRTVAIKAIVTEEFKKYLIFESNNAIFNCERDLKQIEMESTQYLEALKKESRTKEIAEVKVQVDVDKEKINRMILELKRRIKIIKDLELNSFYSQGTIESFTNLKIGDNLYEKLGGIEIIVKDGLVQAIQKVAFQPKK
jgi:hypothetical protein